MFKREWIREVNTFLSRIAIKNQRSDDLRCNSCIAARLLLRVPQAYKLDNESRENGAKEGGGDESSTPTTH